MQCPGDGEMMVFKNSGGMILKRLVRAVAWGALGSVAGPAGAVAGAAIAGSRKGKRDVGYWECPKCGYFEWIKREKH